MPGATQPSLIPSDHPSSFVLDLRVAASGHYVWGKLHTIEHSGRQRRLIIPHTIFSAAMLGLPDDMRDIFTAWLYADTTEVIRVAKVAIATWQDDCDEEGGHPAHNR